MTREERLDLCRERGFHAAGLRAVNPLGQMLDAPRARARPALLAFGRRHEPIHSKQPAQRAGAFLIVSV
jgi:hypothetical protein